MGWSWEEVILAIIDEIVSGDTGHPGFEWEKASLCIFIAVVVLTVGWHIDAAVGVYRKKELEQLRQSIGTEDAPAKGGIVMNPIL